jgi:hypothetical protein
MELQTVRVEFVQPVVGEALFEEEAKRRRQSELERKRDELDVEIAALAEDAEEERKARLGERKSIEGALAKLKKELAQAKKERTMAIVLQTATLGGRMRQVTALGRLEEWWREQKLKNLGVDPDDPEQPTDKELAEVSLTAKQSEDYWVMSMCCVLEGCVVRDEDGEPVVENFTWPKDIHDWTKVPGAFIEAALDQAYILNPSWKPDWGMEPRDDVAKN